MHVYVWVTCGVRVERRHHALLRTTQLRALPACEPKEEAPSTSRAMWGSVLAAKADPCGAGEDFHIIYLAKRPPKDYEASAAANMTLSHHQKVLKVGRDLHSFLYLDSFL